MAADATAARAGRVGGDTTPEFIVLAVAAGALLLLGLLMTFSASFVASTAESGNAFGIFGRQLLWCALGLPPLVVTALGNYHRLERVAQPLLWLSLAAAAVVLVPGVGIVVGGARRWLDLGPMRFQPTEMLKLTVPLYLSGILARRWVDIRRGDLRALVVPAVPLTAAVFALVVAEPDLETAALLAVIAGVVLVAAGLPLRLAGVAGGALCVAGAAGILTQGFRMGRIHAWLDPMSDASNYGYQTVQGYLALGSGGWTGAGLGQGRGKWLYVPNAHTDYIFAIIGEELGLLGALTVLALFAAIAVTGVRVARLAPDPFGRLLASGVTGWLLLQAVVNIGPVVGLLPVTGVTLPLVSFGGSSLVFTMLGVGVLLSVARAVRTPARPAAGAGP